MVSGRLLLFIALLFFTPIGFILIWFVIIALFNLLLKLITLTNTVFHLIECPVPGHSVRGNTVVNLNVKIDI